MSGCAQYRFEAWDDSSPSVGNWVDVDGTSYTFAPNTAGSWRWQVRVRKDDGTTGDAPHTNGFIVSPSSNSSSCTGGVPTLSSPGDGSNLTAGQAVTFSWSAVAGCSRYRFEAWDDSSTGVGNWVDVDGTSYTFAPSVTGSWRWQVRVRKADGSVGDAPHTNGFTVSGSSAGHDWAATYYKDTNLGSQCNAGGIDGTYVFQDWGDSAAVGGCPSDNWSARFTRRMHFDGGSYTFGLGSDDWARLWVNGDLVVDNWQGHGQHREGRQLAAGDYDIRIEYADTLGSAKLSAWWWGPGYDVPQDSAQDGCWLANYWGNPELWWDAAAKVRECSTFFDHDWGSQAPVKNLPADQFSGAAVKTANFDAGWTRFHIRTDDGGRLYVDGNLYLDDWVAHSATERIADVQLAAGPHTVRYEFVDFGGDASAHVWWDPALPSPPSTGDPCGGGTVAYWDMTEGSGNTIHDKCHGYDGSWSQGASWGSDAEGPYLQFAGGNGQRILINQPALSDATSTTVELRVMRGTGDGPQRIISQMGPNQLRYMLDYSGSRLDVWGQTGDGWLWFCGDSNTNCLPTGQWVTIQFQIDGSLVHLFYDGQLKWSESLPSPQTLRQTGAPTEIGGGESIYDFDGKIQYVRISRGVRSDFLPSRRSLPLTVTKAGTGDGTVVSVPPGISCGAVCRQTFDAGTAVTLSATPSAGSTFTGWGGDCTGTDACTVTLSAARSVTATFDSVQYGLTVTKSGTGAGTVTSSPAGIDCGVTCAYAFAGGTTVTLTAAADASSTFEGWGGACSGTGSCTVTLDAAKSVTASFTRLMYTLTVSKDGSGGGSVTSSPAGIDCGADCNEQYPSGTQVTLTASAAAGSNFAGWGGDCAAAGSASTCALTMSADHSAPATFATAVAAPAVSGLTLSPASVTGGASSTGTVTLAAAAPTGGTVVALSSSDAAASVPISTTVAEGATKATFPITTSPAAVQTAVKITATSGSSSKVATLTVKPPVLSSVSLSPSTVLGSKPSTGTVKLSGAAPVGGVVVTLTSDTTAAATVPASVTVSEGATTATFAISTAPVPSTVKVSIGAATGGTSKSAALTVTAPAPSALSFAPATVTGGCQGTTGTVTLSAAVVVDTTVTLAVSAGGEAVSSLPTNVVVPAGSSTAQFSVGSQGVAAVTTVSVTATANGASKAASFKVRPPVPTALTVSPTSVKGGAASTGTVAVDCAPVADLSVSLTVTSGGTAVASMPATMTIPAGSTSGTFTVATKAVTAKTSVKAQATADGVSKTATLTVNP